MQRASIFTILIIVFVLYGCDDNAAIRANNTATATAVENFALLDHHGEFHELFYYSDAKAIALYIQGNGCPIARKALPVLRQLREDYSSQGIVFLMLNANLQDTRTSIAREADEFGIDFPILVDDTQLIAESLNITRTGEVLLIDPKTWTLRYRGPIDDRLVYEFQKQQASEHYLRDALDAHLNGKTIVMAERQFMGCLVSITHDRSARQAISYSEQVVPILQKRCVICHQEGGIGPWAMTSYAMIRGWGPMMREVIRTRRMPPWQADPEIGTFHNDLSLRVAEAQTLVHWLEAGAPQDSGDDPLDQQVEINADWQLGEPDLVIDIAKQDIPESGLIDYRYLEIPVPLGQDAWVRAVEFRPSNKRVLHHGFAFLTVPGGESETPEDARLKAENVFATYAPGFGAEVLPDEAGRLLPATGKLIIELHYTATGRPETDSPQIAIYIAKQQPQYQVRIEGLWNAQFEIPAYEKHYQDQAEHVFTRDILIYGLMPHMHYRGKSARFTAYYPDGSREDLLSVPHYNFNWQRYYNLQTPKKIPAGTRIVLTEVFDNSPQNRLNPDPDATIRWGPYSTDEMLAGYITYRYWQ